MRDKRVREGKFIDGVLCYQCCGCKKWKWKTAYAPVNHHNSKCGITGRCRPCLRVQNAASKRTTYSNEKLAARRAADERDAQRRQMAWETKLRARGWLEHKPIVLTKDLRDYSVGPLAVYR